MTFRGLFFSACRDPAEVPWLLGDHVSSWEGSNIQRAWRLLRTALEKHDTLENGWAYRKAVFTRILDLDRLGRVPAWLIKFFEDEEPEYLIRTQLKYGLVEQALQYSLNLIRKVRHVPLPYLGISALCLCATLGSLMVSTGSIGQPFAITRAATASLRHLATLHPH